MDYDTAKKYAEEVAREHYSHADGKFQFWITCPCEECTEHMKGYVSKAVPKHWHKFKVKDVLKKQKSTYLR